MPRVNHSIFRFYRQSVVRYSAENEVEPVRELRTPRMVAATIKPGLRRLILGPVKAQLVWESTHLFRINPSHTEFIFL